MIRHEGIVAEVRVVGHSSRPKGVSNDDISITLSTKHDRVFIEGWRGDMDQRLAEQKMKRRWTLTCRSTDELEV